MPSEESLRQRMCQAVGVDEPLCLWCLKSLDACLDWKHILIKDTLLCAQCRSRLHPVCEKVHWQKKTVWILYEDNEGFQELWDQYARAKDSQLADVFLAPFSKAVKTAARKPLVRYGPAGRELGRLDDPLQRIWKRSSIWMIEGEPLLFTAGNSKIKKPFYTKADYNVFCLEMPLKEELKNDMILQQAGIIFVLRASRAFLDTFHPCRRWFHRIQARISEFHVRFHTIEKEQKQ